MDDFLTINFFLIADAIVSPAAPINGGGFLQKFPSFIPSIYVYAHDILPVIVPFYFFYRLYLLDKYSKVKQRSDDIHASVIAFWERKFGSMKAVLENVLVEDLRVIGKKNEIETRRYKQSVITFYTLSVVLWFLFYFPITANALGSFPKTNTTFISISISILIAALCFSQIIYFAFTIRANYYQDRYYKRLEQLELDANDNVNTPRPQRNRHPFQMQFRAGDAKLYGPKFEEDEIMESIRFQNKNDLVQWEFSISKPAVFLVVIEQACENGCGGEYEISIGSERLVAEVKETGSREAFTHYKAGHLPITVGGEHTLAIKAITLRGNGLMNLKSVLFYPPNGSQQSSNQTQRATVE